MFAGLVVMDKDKDEMPLISQVGGDYDRNKLKYELMELDTEETVDILKAEYLQKKDVNLGLAYYKEKYSHIPCVDDTQILLEIYKELDIAVPTSLQNDIARQQKRHHKQMEKETKEREKDIKRTKKEYDNKLHFINEIKTLSFE